MGKRGPKPKPTALQALQGNPSRRPLNSAEPTYTLEAAPPRWLTDGQREFWDQLAPMLQASKVLTAADGPALTLLCTALAEVRSAARQLHEDGRLIPTNDGVKGHPAATHMTAAIGHARALLAEFGMTPASRSKVIAQAQEEEDELEKFLKG